MNVSEALSNRATQLRDAIASLPIFATAINGVVLLAGPAVTLLVTTGHLDQPRPPSARRHGPIPDGGDRLPLVEQGAGGERLREPLGPERLADLSAELDLSPAQRWPHPEADPTTQALGRPGQHRRPLRVALHQRRPREPDQAQGDDVRRVGRQAQIQRLAE